MALYGSSLPLDNGGYVMAVVCPNEYSWCRLREACDAINPEAAEPVIPHDLAAKMQRDGIVPIAGSGVPNPGPSIPPGSDPVGQPPNCDGHGNTSAPPSLAEIAAAQMRAHDLEREDDTGEVYDVSADRAFAAGGSE